MLKLNNFLKNISIFILIILLLLGFYTSYNSLKIDNLAFVVAIGIDRGNSDNNLKISFQIAKPSSMSESNSEKGTTTVINTVETTSISSATNLMNSYIEKQINFSHCRLVVFSEAVASDGISDIIYTLANNVQVRPSTNIIISKTDAKYYLENSTTNLESLPVKYYDIFPNSSRYTGYISDSTLGDFYNALNSDVYEPFGILGGVFDSNEDSLELYAPKYPLDYGNIKANKSPITGNRGAENIGLAVFKGDKIIGELNAIETVCFSIITNQIDGFFVTIEDPKNTNKYIDLYIYHNGNTTKNVKIVNNTPYITINCKFDGKIYSMKEDVNYLDSEVLEEISENASKYIETEMYNYLYKTSKKFKSDITGFGISSRINFLTTKDFENFNWADNYQNSFFKVNCDTNIKSGFLVTET